MGSDLDNDISVRDIDRCITDSRENNAVDFISISEVRNDVVTFMFFNFTTDERNMELLSI
jgi:hypothetical protein